MMNQELYRKKRRQRKKRRRLLTRVCLLFVIIGLGTVAVRLAEQYDKGLFGLSDRTTFSDSFDTQNCPESLLEIARKNPETIEFVENYAKEKTKKHTINLSGEVNKGTIPLFMQWDTRWGYEMYGDDMMAVTGCGPTCLSMVVCGLSGSLEWSPLKVAQMAEEKGYYVSGSGSSWNLMSEGAGELGLTVHKIRFEESAIKNSLKNHQPVICIMGPGDFTTTGHFIVLSGLDSSGKVEVRDPFRRKNSKAWELEEIMGQVRELWAYSY
ncbi:MAG: hypothetical protein HFI75_06385 [Lachnospiraceae bacterium]|nr:hypothetical protein [Lachnospiraceae bacterium]